MNTHHYSPDEALALLMRKLQERDETLTTLVRDAINAGKEDTLPIESKHINGQAEKPHEYRKIVPFSPEEALQVALDVLQAYFIEQPLLINEITKNIAYASEIHDVEIVRNFADVSEIQIELHTETQIDEGDGNEFTLIQISNEHIEEQKNDLALLKDLMHFSGE